MNHEAASCLQFMEGSRKLIVIRFPACDIFLPLDQVEALIIALRAVVKDGKHHKIVSDTCLCNLVDDKPLALPSALKPIKS